MRNVIAAVLVAVLITGCLAGCSLSYAGQLDAEVHSTTSFAVALENPFIPGCDAPDTPPLSGVVPVAR